MIDPVGSSGSTAATVAAGTKSNESIDQRQFLLLFIEQLKHQDPLSPLEPDQLTAQLAQFSSLEQLTGINTRLDALTGTTEQQVGTTLLGLLGREVVYRGDRFAIEGGQAPEVAYTLSESVTALTATVTDADGRVVRTVDLGRQDAGAHTFAFDGKASSGAALPDGEYRVALSATVDGGEQALDVPVDMRAVVDGVDFTQDPPVLTAGGRSIPLDQILRVQPAGDDDQDS